MIVAKFRAYRLEYFWSGIHFFDCIVCKRHAGPFETYIQLVLSCLYSKFSIDMFSLIQVCLLLDYVQAFRLKRIQ